MVGTKENFLSLVDNLYDGVFILASDLSFKYWNKSLEIITGLDETTFAHSKFSHNTFEYTDQFADEVGEKECPFLGALKASFPYERELLMRHANGRRMKVFMKAVPLICDDGEHAAAFIISTTPSREDEGGLLASLADLAYTDPLTQLPNRRHTESYLNQKIHEYARIKGLVMVMFFDIDDFRHVNNQYGHDLGDCVLIQIASKLKKLTRKSDIIGRWGGEEFIGVFTLAHMKDYDNIIEKVRAIIKDVEVVADNGDVIHITVSIGVTMLNDGDKADSVVRRADQLMYESKNNGKNCVTCDIAS